MKHWWSAILIVVSTFTFADEVKELYWEDLVPNGYVIPDLGIDHGDAMMGGNMMQSEPNAPLVEALDGTRVKIPGFVVPLEGDPDSITEFLLVPYFGACIHVPPPPSNQIVYVKFTDGVAIENLYDAVWVEGRLSTDGWVGEIASVGYRLSGIDIMPFEG